jgi:hypothetical protein
MEMIQANKEDEIRSILLEALALGKEFIIWSRTADDELDFKITATLDAISETGSLKFILKSPLTQELAKDLYFAVNDYSIIFKQNEISLRDDVLLVKLPFGAKYRERRRHPRTKFKIHERKDIEVKFRQMKSGAGHSLTIVSQLLDISESGAKFLISKETLIKINPKVHFNIKSLTSINIKFTKAKIMNASSYKGATLSQGEFFAVGIVFII